MGIFQEASLNAILRGAILRGTPGPDDLEATREDQIVLGLGGDDVLTSFFDRTALLGGWGDDVLTTTVTKTAPFEGRAETSVVQHGGAGDDRLTVDAQANVFAGEAELNLLVDGGRGDDVIEVEAGMIGGFISARLDSLILGGDGDDTITARMLADAERIDGSLRILGGSGDDVIDASCTDRDRSGQILGDARTRILGGSGEDEITAFASASANGFVVARNFVDGGTDDDAITGRTFCLNNNSRSEQTNTLYGGLGNDVLTALHDTFSVSTAFLTNELFGGQGHDRLIADYALTEEAVEVLDVRNMLSGHRGADSLSAIVDISGASPFLIASRIINTLDGGSGDDVLIAGVLGGGATVTIAQNRLSGGGGDDRLTVTGGLDNVLDGGAGADTFVFDLAETTPLTISIAGFSSAADRLEFAGISDAGGAGLADDLDAISTFSYDSEGDLVIAFSALELRILDAAPGIDSFEELVDDPQTQLITADDPMA